jgi:hypothetical protein
MNGSHASDRYGFGRVCGLVATAIGLQVLLASPAIGAPILYNFSFTPTQSNTPLPTASFVYDSDQTQFSNFIVHWNNNSYDFTQSAMAPFDRTGALYSSMCSSSGAALAFLFLTNGSCFSTIQNYSGPKYYFLTQQNGTSLQFHTYNSSEGMGLEVANPLLAVSGETYGIGHFVVSSAGPATPPTPVPEPATLSLMLLGAATLLPRARRRRDRGLDACAPTERTGSI